MAIEVDLEDQRLLAWFYFPEEWTFALTQRGERGRRRRRQLRLLATAKAIKEHLRKRGESCATCSSYSKGVCLADSDWWGETHVKSTNLCTDWSPRG